MNYMEFKGSNKYGKVFSASEVAYHIYLESDTTLIPIGRGSGFNVDGTIEQIPVEEYGVEIVREYADGKYTIAGRFESFFIPGQEDMMPNTQNFRDKKYVIQMICAGSVNAKILDEYTYTDQAGAEHILAANAPLDLNGLVLKQWDGVKFSGKGLNQSSRGLIGVNVPFVASREFSGDEIYHQIETQRGTIPDEPLPPME